MGFFYWLDQYTDTIQHFIATKLVLAPLLLLFIEEAGVPLLVPGDVIIAYTGYRISLNPSGAALWEAFVTAQVAVIAGSSVLFFLSRRWGQLLIDKLAKFVFLKESHVHRAERLFAKYGVLGIIVGRHIPGMRIAVTVFAATAGVRYLTFVVSTFISTSAWIIIFLSVGRGVGANFHTDFQRYIGVSLGIIAGVTGGILLLHLIGMLRRRHRARRQQKTDR
ncbi:MAG TPA: DedA family protein [Candidatus Saccharimonadales bacterium]|nr:DedA family protein [Candidatus Saccharimonadales bacterium]